MDLQPVGNHCIIEPVLRSDVVHQELKRRAQKSGLFVSDDAGRPDNLKDKFEGVPCMGRLVKLPAGYSGSLKAGNTIIFKEDSPRGFKHEGRKLMAVELKQVIGVINDDIA